MTYQIYAQKAVSNNSSFIHFHDTEHPKEYITGRVEEISSEIGTSALSDHEQERTGLIDNLNHAVNIISMAVDATPQDYPN